MTPERKAHTHNSTYNKLAVQWLNEVLCFVSSFVVADSLVLRNRQLLVAAKPLPASVGRPTRPPTDDLNSTDNFAVP